MAFWQGSGSFMKGAELENRQAEQLYNTLATAISQKIQKDQFEKKMEMEERKLDIAAQKDSAFNVKRAGEEQIIQQLMETQGMTRGQAAAAIMDARSQRLVFDPMTQEMVQQPGLFGALGLPRKRPVSAAPALGLVEQRRPDPTVQQRVDAGQLPIGTKGIVPDRPKVEAPGFLGRAGRAKAAELGMAAEMDLQKQSIMDMREKTDLRKYSDAQVQAANFGNRMAQSSRLIDELITEDPAAQYGKTGKLGVVSRVLEILPLGDFGSSLGEAAVHAGATPEQQQYMNAAENWVTANLRKESGAAIGVEEKANEYKKYFPIPGDSDELILTKAKMRKEAERGMLAQSGGAYQLAFGKKAQAMQKFPPRFLGKTIKNKKTGETITVTKDMIK